MINIKKKTMKKRLWLLLLLVIPLFISSCSKEDGDWDPMKWQTEVKKSSDGNIHVSPNGGTFVFYCKNYSSFWLTEVTESEPGGTEKHFYPEYNDRENFSIKEAAFASYLILIEFTVTIEPTTSNGFRFIKLEIEAGDVFDEFNFRQSGLKTGL